MKRKKRKRIESFRGKYFFLSNFSPSIVRYRGKLYPTVEHAYQSAKAVNAQDAERIRLAKTAGEAKRLGRQIVMRANFDEYKVKIMRTLLRRKFAIKHLREQLLATGDAVLIEGNNWGDTFWGCVNGKGDNRLGNLLMSIREALAS